MVEGYTEAIKCKTSAHIAYQTKYLIKMDDTDPQTEVNNTQIASLYWEKNDYSQIIHKQVGISNQFVLKQY